MSVDEVTLVESYLDSIQNGITVLHALIKPDQNHSDKNHVLEASSQFLNDFNVSMDCFNSSYQTYQKEITNSGVKLQKNLNKEFQKIIKNINDVKTKIKECKEEGNDIAKIIDTFANRNHKEPRICFKNNMKHSYEFDIELMKKYPGSYFMELYKDPQMWMDNGDIYIDHNDDNYEYILKYMKNDETLVDDLKNMNNKKKNEFVNDLNFMSLPIKVEYINELCFDMDKMKMKAWKKRIIMMNGKYATYLNIYLKKHGLFDSVFNKNNIENIKYNENNNIIYVNMIVNCADFINDYCQKNVIHKELIQKDSKYNTFSILENELKMFGIEFNENEMNEIKKCFNSNIFMKSTILESSQYDYKLQEWLESNHPWELIYRASEHKYSAKSFHKYCDNKGPTLIIIKSNEGWIFGGYTKKSWNANTQELWNTSEFKNDSNAFIFTLNNPFGILPTKFNKRKESHYAIYCNPNYGPVFCNKFGYDLCINNMCNQINSCTCNNDGSYAYTCDPIYLCSLFVNSNERTKTNTFSILDYEVYIEKN